MGGMSIVETDRRLPEGVGVWRALRHSGSVRAPLQRCSAVDHFLSESSRKVSL